MLLFSSLPEFSLFLPGSGKVGDTAYLMRCLYQFWYHKGHWGSVSSSAVDLLNTVAVLIVALLFTMHFRWDFALQCASEEECAHQSLLRGVSFPHVFSTTFLGRLFGLSFLLSALGAVVYEAAAFVANVRVAGEVEEMAKAVGLDTGFRTPYHRWMHSRHRCEVRGEGHEDIPVLRTTRRPVSLISWGEFVESMCEFLASSGKLKGCEGGVHLDALLAMQALMQRENFLVALYDSDVLRRGSLQYMDPDTLLFLISASFDPRGVVYPVDEGLWKVREHAARYALLNFALYFFIATFSVVKVLVKNAGQFKAEFHSFSQRDWNNAARWRFRLFNEALHLHECRLNNGRDIAAKMTERLAVSNSTRRLLRRVSSTCILVTMSLTFLNPSLLIGGYIAGLSLVWWLTIGVMVFSAVQEPDVREREYIYLEDLETLIHEVHFADPEWDESGESFYAHITAHLFPYRAQLLLGGLLRALAAPFLLFWCLRDEAVVDMLTFMRDNSVVVAGVGSVPVDAVFGAGDEGDEPATESTSDHDATSGLLGHAAGGGQDVCVDIPSLGTFPGASSGSGRSRMGKVEQSIASFCAAYPQWMAAQMAPSTPTAAGSADSPDRPVKAFVLNLHEKVREQMAAGENVNASLGNSWVPPFTGRRSHGIDVSQDKFSRELGEVNGGDSRSEDPITVLLSETTTAHQRQHLFVSQVGLSRASLMVSQVPSQYTTYGASLLASQRRRETGSRHSKNATGDETSV